MWAQGTVGGVMVAPGTAPPPLPGDCGVPPFGAGTGAPVTGVTMQTWSGGGVSSPAAGAPRDGAGAALRHVPGEMSLGAPGAGIGLVDPDRSVQVDPSQLQVSPRVPGWPPLLGIASPPK